MEHLPPNQFLSTLLQKGSSLLQTLRPSGQIVILCPISSSLQLQDRITGQLYSSLLNDEFLSSHILRVTELHKDRSRAKSYSTINGKTVVIKDDLLFPHRGYKGVREVRILHDSLIYLDDAQSNPLLVYFLDKPLLGNAMQPQKEPRRSTIRGPISTWVDLCGEFKGVAQVLNPELNRLFKEFNDSLQTTSPTLPVSNANLLLLQNGNLQSSLQVPTLTRETSLRHHPTLVALRESIETIMVGAITAFQSLPAPLVTAIAQQTKLTGPEIEKMIETHILGNVYDMLFYRLSALTSLRDEEISTASDNARYVDITQLGLSGNSLTLPNSPLSISDVRARLNRAIVAFRGFGSDRTPLGKLSKLLEAIKCIMSDSEKSSDDLIPTLVCVVLRANVSALASNILYVKEFSFLDLAAGEFGYALSTLEAVVYHITSTASLSDLSRRNFAFLRCVKEGDMVVIKSMVDSDPGLLRIRDEKGESPYQLTSSPEILDVLLNTCTEVDSLCGLLLSTYKTSRFERTVDAVLSLGPPEKRFLVNETDSVGQSIGHKIFEYPDLISSLGDSIDWTIKDNQSQTPLSVFARIYDHPLYEEVFEASLSCASPVALADHIDAKGNTLAHIVCSKPCMEALMRYAYGDFNVRNSKGLTPLLQVIKFARVEVIQVLLSQKCVNPASRDIRGNSGIHFAARSSLAVFEACLAGGMLPYDRVMGSGITPMHIASREANIPVLNCLLERGIRDNVWDWRGAKAVDVAKNEQVRNLLDGYAVSGREVRVLRGIVSEDCTVRYLIRAKTGEAVYRTLADFQSLRGLLVQKYPALGIPTLNLKYPPPCILHSRPSRTILMAITERLDCFVDSLLNHPSLAKDELTWDFLLITNFNHTAATERVEVQAREAKESIWAKEKPLTDISGTQIFFGHAREQILVMSAAYEVLERKARLLRDGYLHLSVAYGLVGRELAGLSQIPELENGGYLRIIEEMSETMIPKEPSLLYLFVEDIVSIASGVTGILVRTLCILN